MLAILFHIRYLAWGVSAVLLVVWYCVLRWVPREEAPAPAEPWRPGPLRFRLDRYDAVSLTLIGTMLALLWIGHRDLFPIPPDGYYHLRVAQQILKTGHIPLWNDWEFAPVGRPHLYPPLFHLILAAGGWAYRGDLMAAYRAMLPLVLVVSHLATWFLARWMFDSRRALASLLLVGADPLLAVIALCAPPSVLAGVFATVMLPLFFAGHLVAAVCLGVLSAYTHMSIIPLTLLGLAIFCAWRRDYLPRLAVLALAVMVLSAPWYARVWMYRGSFQHPIEMGIYGVYSKWAQPFVKIAWLQLLNLGLCLVAIRAARTTRWRDPRDRSLVALAAGFLPMLISYGGRYFAHTVQFWAILAGEALAPLLRPPRNWRRLALLLFPVVCPTVVLIGFGSVMNPGLFPMGSAWLLSPGVALGGARLMKGGEKLGLAPFEDAQKAAAYIRAHCNEDAIVHFPRRGDRDLALMIGFLTDRRIDDGAWEETQPDAAGLRRIRQYAQSDTTGCYVATEPTAMPPRARITRFGRVYVGVSAVQGLGP